jgi:hypothetical protein
MGKAMPEARSMPEPRPMPEARPAARAAGGAPTLAALAMGNTLAPATGATSFAEEEQVLAEMTAALKSEDEATADTEMVAATAPVGPAPAPMPPPSAGSVIPAAPIAAQAAAVAEAMAKAAPAPLARTAVPPASREVFIPRAPIEPRAERIEPRMEGRAPALPLGEPPAKTAPPLAAEPAPAKPEGRLSLFSRYRSLTSRPRVESAKAPEPPAKVERPGVAVSVGPQDRGGISSHDEAELEIPAFLRRQAN